MSLGTANKGKQAAPIRRQWSRDEQLRRERFLGVLILIALAALMALAIWAATLGGGMEGIDYNHWIVPWV